MIVITLRKWPFVYWTRQTASNTAIGWMMLTVTIFSAGTYSGFAKVLTSALAPLAFVFVSELLTAMFVLLSFGAMPMLRKLMQLDKKLYLPLLVVGLTSGTAAPLLMFVGLGASSAVNASLLGNTEMVFLMLLAMLLLGERCTRAQVASACLIFFGMIVIALRGFTEGFVFQWGDVLLVAASLTWAVGSITFRKYLHQDPHMVLLVRSMIAVMFFFVLSSLIGPSVMDDILLFPLELVPALLGFAFISRFLNVFSFYEAIDRLPVTSVSLLCNLTSIVSILFAHFYAGESIQYYHLAGGGLIILGTILLEMTGLHPSRTHHEAHLRQQQAQRM